VRAVEPCSRCGRTLREVVRGLGLEARRGREPFCRVPGCPVYGRLAGFLPAREVRGTSVYGPSPPSLFVGRVGWPVVSAGPLVPPGEVVDAATMDDPAAWTKLDLGEVLALRSGLVRGKARVRVHDAARLADPSGALVASQELAMSSRPAHTELTLSKPVSFALGPVLHGFAAPTGPSVTVRRAVLTENTSVPRRVDAAVADVHASALDAIREMYHGGVSPYHIQRVLSVGLLGRARARRFVPTRWSVTATDDQIGKVLMPRVRDLQPLGEVELRRADLHGNRFLVVLLPGPWKYEMLEAWMASERGVRTSMVLADREGTDGRTTYADSITGAYYAARLAVLEHLLGRRRSATALVLREITDDYYAPAGVWVIREGVRAAMLAPPERPADETTLLGALRAWAPQIPFAERSAFLTERRFQRTLDAFGA